MALFKGGLIAMKKWTGIFLGMVVVLIFSAPLQAADVGAAKDEAMKWVDQYAPRLKKVSNSIYLYAEPPLQEYRSGELLAKELEKAGFKVDRNPAGMKVDFVATYGQGKPVIGTYAEYDATEGLSQMPVPYPKQIVEGAGGFQDMHNGLGAGAVAGALAAKAVMEKMKIPGTLKVFDRRPGRRVEAPMPTRSTSSQATTTSRRWRSTARVQRSGIAHQAYATAARDAGGKP